ncbi:hypothetical protein ACFQWH_02620 [Mycolicibacterium sp. GCM10028919]|uniref:hypothetical protein n=1 Tax=Mycolicibacterium sp. GCM10028919 TaxID=3273401 RepID=UPI003614DB00
MRAPLSASLLLAVALAGFGVAGAATAVASPTDPRSVATVTAVAMDDDWDDDDWDDRFDDDQDDD